MKDLSAYRKNGYSYNYVVVLFDVQGILQYEVARTKKQAENKNCQYFNCHGEVLTFKQAVRKYPEHFCL